MLKFFSASNEMVNSKKAMEDCITRSLESEDGTDCDLIIFHTTMGHKFTELTQKAREMSPSAEVVGCTCAGVVGREGAMEKIRSLAVMIVKGPKSEFAIAYKDNIRGHNSYEIAEAAAKELKEKNPNVNMINVLASGIDIAADDALRGIESVFGKEMPIFGGTSSDNIKAKVNYQFINDVKLEQGAILIGFADPSLEVLMGAHHGNNPIGMPFEVTRAEANRIYEIDGEPAWPFLMKKLDLPVDTELGDAMAMACIGTMLPDALHEEYDNQHILYVIIKVDKENQSFYIPVSCEVGTKFWLVQRDEKLIFSGLDRLMNKLTNELNGRKPRAVFHTDCAARGRLMFNKIEKGEIIDNMQKPLFGDNIGPWLGLYGFGEITLLGGCNTFHNQTTSLYILADS
ncbi:MAG: FIST C-terminal domain-containing protein [Magnetococcales bacterium]|nr:FIST C-terminal domain-containing protein [Magnetococcales bacterium]